MAEEKVSKIVYEVMMIWNFQQFECIHYPESLSAHLKLLIKFIAPTVGTTYPTQDFQVFE